MSRIGKKPIAILKGVKATLQGDQVLVEGPKGKLSMALDPHVDVKIEGEEILCSLKEDSTNRARHGLIRNLVANMVQGCGEGFQKKLDVVGVGYKVALKEKELELNLGYSHAINYRIPDGITIKVEPKTNKITVEGADRRLVGQTAAEIRSFREPEPYKGKGVKYSDEVVRRKVGKAAGTAAAS